MKVNFDKCLNVCEKFVENESAYEIANKLERNINQFHQTAGPNELARNDDGILEAMGEYTVGAVTYGYAYGVAETKAHNREVAGKVALLGLGYLLFKYRKPIMSVISSKFKKKETVINYGPTETTRL